MTTPQNDPARLKKTLREAQTTAFTTQLFYFSMKILFCYVLLRYRNFLSGSWEWIGLYVLLLAGNVYMILTTGRNPGYQPQKPSGLILQEQTTDFITPNCDPLSLPSPIAESQSPSEHPTCQICNCKTRIRTKHCYRCGRCVRKYDHHCPWIGACVGEGNHCRFVGMLVGQTVQAIVSFIVCWESMGMYQYKERSQTHANANAHGQKQPPTLQQYYSQQFGVFAIFSLFMFAYILFVGGLFFFHLFLIVSNMTTTQLMSRSKAKYLHKIKGNPFTRGPIENVMSAIWIPDGGQYFFLLFFQCVENLGKWVEW